MRRKKEKRGERRWWWKKEISYSKMILTWRFFQAIRSFSIQRNQPYYLLTRKLFQIINYFEFHWKVLNVNYRCALTHFFNGKSYTGKSRTNDFNWKFLLKSFSTILRLEILLIASMNKIIFFFLCILTIINYSNKPKEPFVFITFYFIIHYYFSFWNDENII